MSRSPAPTIDASANAVQTDHIEQFHREGYTLIRGLIPRDVTERVRQRGIEVVYGQSNWPVRTFQIVDPTRYRRPDGGNWPGGIQRPANQEDIFKSMSEHPNLKAAMAGLLGGDVQLYTEQLGVKYGFITEEQGSCSFYHQDSYYWKIEPQHGCNVWIPLQEVDKDAIALAVMPRSQEGWQLLEHEQYYDDPAYCGPDGTPFKRHRIPFDKIDFSKEVLVPMQPGDALFFSNFTWHRSEPNRTGRDLSFYAIAYRLTLEAAKARTAVA